MDTQDMMSATANISVKDSVNEAVGWKAFAPLASKQDILSMVTDTVEKPQFTLKSRSTEQTELRFQIEDRLGIVGLLQKGGVVEVAFPFVRSGHECELEILEVTRGSSEAEGWVLARGLGVEFSFYDALHALGTAMYEPGETRRFVLNAFALSLKRVTASTLISGLDEVELGFSTTRLHSYVAKKGRCRGQGIFQSEVTSEPQNTAYRGREFELLPIRLAGHGEERLLVDLVVAPELMETFQPPLAVGEEIAGVIWLHGYSPDLLTK